METHGCIRCQSGFRMSSEVQYCHKCICWGHGACCAYDPTNFIQTTEHYRNIINVLVTMKACQICRHCGRARQPGRTTCFEHRDLIYEPPTTTRLTPLVTVSEVTPLTI